MFLCLCIHKALVMLRCTVPRWDLCALLFVLHWRCKGFSNCHGAWRCCRGCPWLPSHGPVYRAAQHMSQANTCWGYRWLQDIGPGTAAVLCALPNLQGLQRCSGTLQQRRQRGSAGRGFFVQRRGSYGGIQWIFTISFIMGCYGGDDRAFTCLRKCYFGYDFAF